jgi:uridine kinase
MIGDKLVIKEFHTKAARGILEIIYNSIKSKKGKFIITIAGESGSGKSEIASELAKLLEKEATKTYIIQQDDYFVYPPKTNEKMRRKNIGHVGMGEVKLNLLEKNLKTISSGARRINKPLVIFDEDSITEETINISDIEVFIVEGTYTTILNNVDIHIFIDRTYKDTRKSRFERAREEQDDFLEKVLKIEHNIISQHKKMADIIVTKDYSVKNIENAM